MPRRLKIDQRDAKHIAIDLFNQLMKNGLIDQTGNSINKVTRIFTDYFSKPIQLHQESVTSVEDEPERTWFHNQCEGMLVQMDEQTWVCDKCATRVGNPDLQGSL